MIIRSQISLNLESDRGFATAQSMTNRITSCLIYLPKQFLQSVLLIHNYHLDYKRKFISAERECIDCVGFLKSWNGTSVPPPLSYPFAWSVLNFLAITYSNNLPFLSFYPRVWRSHAIILLTPLFHFVWSIFRSSWYWPARCDRGHILERTPCHSLDGKSLAGIAPCPGT